MLRFSLFSFSLRSTPLAHLHQLGYAPYPEDNDNVKTTMIIERELEIEVSWSSCININVTSWLFVRRKRPVNSRNWKMKKCLPWCQLWFPVSSRIQLSWFELNPYKTWIKQPRGNFSTRTLCDFALDAFYGVLFDGKISCCRHNGILPWHDARQPAAPVQKIHGFCNFINTWQTY